MSKMLPVINGVHTTCFFRRLLRCHLICKNLAFAVALVLMPVPPVAFAATNTPSAVTLPDDTLYFQGRYLYQRHCTTCHGARGDGKGDMATGMFPKPRPFASGIFKYRSTPLGFLPTDADLLRTVRNGISGTSMPTFANLSDREIRAVTEYIKFFSPKWRRPENYAAAIPLPREPAWLENPVALRPHAARGKEMFLASCAACHGESGDGKGLASATLMDEWGQPSQPADLRSPAIRSGPAFTDLYRALVTGIAGTPMPSYAETLNEEQRWDVIAYIATLRREQRTTGTTER